ncbi:type II toxin-antitoxin system death-on-curing family toxin [Metamycoplasma alkalescens]|uniref:type II toxin-antitoxin system death-on-curing family toxin n=1 Tax=Metamycoplasma alkalescens TaxID=45363 RepID=UPI003D06C56D
MKTIYLEIVLTLKTWKEVKNIDRKSLPAMNLDFFPFSNKKRVFFDENTQSFYVAKKDKSNFWKINVKFELIKFNENLISFLESIYSQSIKKLKLLFNIKNDDDIRFKEKEPGSLMGSLTSIVNHYCYIDEEIDIFDFITDIFIRLLNGHFFYDGNKRGTLMFAVQLLKFLGYYFYWNGNNNTMFISDIYSKYLEKELKTFVKKLENKANMGNTKKSIKEWIYKNIMINLW